MEALAKTSGFYADGERTGAMNVFHTLTLRTDPDQALTHFVVTAEDGTGTRAICSIAPAEWDDTPLPINIGLLCPGCVLFLARAFAAHFSLPLAGPRGGI